MSHASDEACFLPCIVFKVVEDNTAEHLAATVCRFQSHQVSFFSPHVCQVPGTSFFCFVFSLGFSHPDLSAPSFFFFNQTSSLDEGKWSEVCVFLCPSLHCSDCPAVVWQDRLCYLWCCLTLCFILISMFFFFLFLFFLFMGSLDRVVHYYNKFHVWLQQLFDCILKIKPVKIKICFKLKKKRFKLHTRTDVWFVLGRFCLLSGCWAPLVSCHEAHKSPRF